MSWYRRIRVNQATPVDNPFPIGDAQGVTEVTVSLSDPELHGTADKVLITPDGLIDQEEPTTVPEVSETLATIQRGDLTCHINDFSDVFFLKNPVVHYPFYMT